MPALKPAKKKRPLRKPSKRPAANAARPASPNVPLVERLWRVAERQAQEIEARLENDDQSPTERARDTRMLAVLAKTLRELIALRTAALESGDDAQTDADDADPVPRDIDEFRRELTRRIESFVASRTDSAVPADHS